jgi:uncharacterized protein (DUF2237 family)
MQTNILGEPIKTCSKDPMTGFLRDGSCTTTKEDFGSHSVCAVMTDEFLEYSRKQGNDLITPMPQYNFPGLKAGDRWCVCASRWKEAYDAGCAPYVNVHATSMLATRIVPKEILLEKAEDSK